jgi:hypothetical protein
VCSLNPLFSTRLAALLLSVLSISGRL